MNCCLTFLDYETLYTDGSKDGDTTGSACVAPSENIQMSITLHTDKKSQTDPLVFRAKFNELLSDFSDYVTLYADGSKDGDTTGSACVAPSETYKCRLPANASIFFQRRSKLLI